MRGREGSELRFVCSDHRLLECCRRSQLADARPQVGVHGRERRGGDARGARELSPRLLTVRVPGAQVEREDDRGNGDREKEEDDERSPGDRQSAVARTKVALHYPPFFGDPFGAPFPLPPAFAPPAFGLFPPALPFPFPPALAPPALGLFPPALP